MKKFFGVLAATVATPIAIGVAFALMGLAGLGWFADKDWRLILTNVALYSYFALPIALATCCLVGLPVAAYLTRRGRTRAIHFCLAGAVSGTVPFVAFDLYVVVHSLWSANQNWPNNEFLGVPGTTSRLFEGVPTALYWLVLGAWCGGWSAFAYWFVVHRGAPPNFALQPPEPAVTPPARQASRQPSGG